MKSTYRLDEKSSSHYLARSHGNLDYMSESVCCSQPRRRPASPAPSAAALLLGHELRHVTAGAQLQRPDMHRSLSSSAGNLALHLVSGATCHDDVRSGHIDGGSQHASHQPTETDQHDVKTLNADVTSRVNGAHVAASVRRRLFTRRRSQSLENLSLINRIRKRLMQLNIISRACSSLARVLFYCLYMYIESNCYGKPAFVWFHCSCIYCFKTRSVLMS